MELLELTFICYGSHLVSTMLHSPVFLSFSNIFVFLEQETFCKISVVNRSISRHTVIKFLPYMF